MVQNISIFNHYYNKTNYKLKYKYENRGKKKMEKRKENRNLNYLVVYNFCWWSKLPFGHTLLTQKKLVGKDIIDQASIIFNCTHFFKDIMLNSYFIYFTIFN